MIGSLSRLMKNYCGHIRSLTVLLVFVLVACTRSIEGFVPPEQILGKFVVGETTRTEIRKQFGTPSLVSPSLSRSLLYMRRESVQLGPTTYEQVRIIVAIRFDSNDRYLGYQTLDAEDGARIRFTRDITEIAGVPKPGIISDIISNIGRFSP